jgi:hypothetical protein
MFNNTTITTIKMIEMFKKNGVGERRKISKSFSIIIVHKDFCMND